MNEKILVIAVLTLAAVMAILLSVGGFLVIRDSVRGRGRWGINLKPVRCPECDLLAPVARRPENLSQALWGGFTCDGCGTLFDKWGRSVGVSSTVPKGRRRSNRQVQRGLSLVFIFAVAGLLVWLGFNGWSIKSLPAEYFGYVLVAVGVAGLSGVNIWRGGPLDVRADPPEPPGDERSAMN